MERFRPGRTVASIVADVLFVFVFVVVGRAHHGHANSVHGVLTTLWPFLTGLLVGWLVLLVAGAKSWSIGSGILLAIITVALGMALRVLDGQGTELAFIGVALAFLSLFFLSWRVIYIRRHRRH
jgi:lipopolysaccharide export LptBFGC system permease protein LptF